MELVAELVKQYGIQGLILALLVLKMFNHDRHSTTEVSEKLDTIIEILSKQEEKRYEGHKGLSEALQNIDKNQALMNQYLHDRLNGGK